MLDKLAAIEKRYVEVQDTLALPETMSDLKKLKEYSREFKELGKIIPVYHQYRQLTQELESARVMLNTEKDEEMRAMAKEELISLEPRITEMEQRLRDMLIPNDPEDSKNVILEIRAGTGGDEACLFAADLFRMYQRFCDARGWKMEVNSSAEGATGGYKEIIATISGEDAFGTLKYEGGVHRVQRVPATETQGRIHTSAASVATMPEMEDFEVELADKDVVVETKCSSGPGGQSVNTTYSAVVLTHLPTGITVSMQDEKSQIKNKEKAMRILKSRIYDLEMNKRLEEQSKLRKTYVSSGDRSAKIRTYNYPQSRVTDHRIGLTVYNLPMVMNGDLNEILEALRLAENAEKLKVGSAS